MSMVEGLRDVGGSTATITPATDDLTAIANVLTGKSDAALVSEANVLLAQNRGRLRVIYTSGATPLPVIAFAPLPQADRDALINALRSMRETRALAPLQMTGLAALEREPRPVAKKIEVVNVTPRDLGIPASLAPPPSIGLRATIPLASAAIVEEMFDTP